MYATLSTVKRIGLRETCRNGYNSQARSLRDTPTYIHIWFSQNIVYLKHVQFTRASRELKACVRFPTNLGERFNYAQCFIRNLIIMWRFTLVSWGMIWELHIRFDVHCRCAPLLYNFNLIYLWTDVNFNFLHFVIHYWNSYILIRLGNPPEYTHLIGGGSG